MPNIRFDNFEIDLDLFRLSRNGEEIDIGQRPMDALVFLIQNRHRVVSKEDLRVHVWEGAALSAATIPTTILTIRKLLGDDAGIPEYIQAVRGRGYRFIKSCELARAPSLQPTGSARTPATLPFVGRRKELQKLEKAALDIAIGRPGRHLHILAEPGMGKSRLIEEFKSETLSRLRLISAGGPCPEAPPAFWAWSQLVNDALARTDISDFFRQKARALSSFVPEIREPEASDSNRSEPATTKIQQASLHHWAKMLLSLATEKPTAFLLDDIHRFDHDALLLLRWIAEDISDSRLLLVTTARHHFATRANAEILSQIMSLNSSYRIELPPLTVDDAAALLDPLQCNLRQSAEELIRRTGGNAFYLNYLVGVIRESPDFDLSTANPVDSPIRAHEIVARQLSHLPVNSKQALSASAVIGDRFAIDDLSEAIGESPETAAAHLEPAIVGSIISEDCGEYAFTHSILREALYHSIDAEHRRHLHLRVAQSIHPNRVASSERAHHLFAALPASCPNDTIFELQKAARSAAKRQAHAAALQLLRRALHVATIFEGRSKTSKYTILIDLARATLYCGDRRNSERIIKEAAQLAREAGDISELTRCALGFAPDFLTIEVGTWDPYLVNLIDEVLPCLNRDDPIRGLLLARKSLANQWNDACIEREALADEALEIGHSSGSDEIVMAALAAKVETLNHPGVANERLSFIRRLGHVANKIQDVPQVLLHHTRAISALLELGDFPTIDSENLLHSELAARNKLSQFSWLSVAVRAMRAGMLGDIAMAEELTESCLAISGSNCDANVRLTIDGQRAVWLFERDQISQACAIASEIVEQYPAIRYWRAVAGWARLGDGAAASAAQTLATFDDDEIARMINEPGGSVGLGALAEIAAAVGSEADRRKIFELIAPLSHISGSGGYGVCYFGLLARHAGNLACSLGMVDKCIELLETAVAAELRRGAVSWAMYASANLIAATRLFELEDASATDQARSILSASASLDLPRAKRVLTSALEQE